MSTDSPNESRFGLDVDVFNLDFDRTAVTLTGMLAFDLLCWVLVVRGYVPMPGMTYVMREVDAPMAAPGVMELGTFHAGTVSAFLGYTVMWGVMMWAMMYPAMTRFTREYAAALQGSSTRVAASVASFLAGYNVTWALSAVVPLSFHALLVLAGYRGIYGFTKTHTHLAIGGVLVLAGVYQLTHFKQAKLRTCCARVKLRPARVSDAFVTGLRHGVSCILVCFGYFFLVMPVFGEMNVFWMVALTFPITVERLPASWGRELSLASGAVTGAAGVLVLAFRPELGVAFTT